MGIDLAQKTAYVGGEAAVGRWKLATNEAQHVPLDLSAFPRAATGGRVPPLKAMIAPDGKHAIAWEGKDLAVFDPATGRQRFLISSSLTLGGVLGTFGSPAARLKCQYFFLPGDRVAVTYRDSPQHGVCVFDLTTGQETGRHTHGLSQTDVACAARTGLLVTVGKRGHSSVKEPNTLALWKPGSPAEFLDTPAGTMAAWVGVTQDGQRALTAGPDGVLLVWDLVQKRVLRRFDLGVPLEAFDCDGRTVIATERNQRATERDPKARHVFEYVRIRRPAR